MDSPRRDDLYCDCKGGSGNQNPDDDVGRIAHAFSVDAIVGMFPLMVPFEKV